MTDLNDSESVRLKVRIAALETEHRDLDTIIIHLESTDFGDQFALQRLKKRKLHLKDEIDQISMQLVPDIPA